MKKFGPLYLIPEADGLNLRIHGGLIQFLLFRRLLINLNISTYRKRVRKS
jgi:hypothetical protein